MDGYYQQVLPTQTKNPLLYDFLAGDWPEILTGDGDQHDSSELSDCESSVSGSSTTSSSSASSARRRGGVFRHGLLVELSEGERIYEVIRRRFLSCLGPVAEKSTTVVSIRRKIWSGFLAQAELQSFQIHSKAVAQKHGGNPNVKFAWFGNRRERIQEIVSNGFSFKELQNNNGGIFLSADGSPAESVEDCIPDENGLRHMLLCRVILGRPEVIQPGSGQTQASSDEFDSGVDRFDNPKKYIIWSTNMNTHILPEYVISFRSSTRSSSFRGVESKMENGMKMPTSPWISFPALIQVLGRFLPSDAIALINKHHNNYKERRISRAELIQRVREIAGDKLLIAVIKSCRGIKELKASLGFLRNRNANK